MYEKKYYKEVLKKSQKEQTEIPPRISKIRRFFFAFLIILFLSLIVAALVHPKLQVNKIVVNGTEVVDPEDIRLSVEKKLTGYYLWIFPKRSTFLIKPNRIASDIKKNFSRIQSIGVSRDGVRGIVFSIDEYLEKYLWCTSNTDCYLMDETGIVYARAPIFSGNAFLKIQTPISIQELPFSGMTNEQLLQLKVLVEGIESLSFVPVAVNFMSDSELRVDIAHNGYTAQFILDPRKPIRNSLEYLFSGMRTAPLSNLLADSTKILEYIDVRFPNNIVYKFKN